MASRSCETRPKLAGQATLQSLHTLRPHLSYSYNGAANVLGQWNGQSQQPYSLAGTPTSVNANIDFLGVLEQQ